MKLPTMSIQTKFSSTSSHASAAEGSIGIASLPRHMWCSIAQYTGLAESKATLTCCTWLLVAFQEETLWQSHALVCGMARSVSGPDASWLDLSVGKGRLSVSIDWHWLLKMNLQARTRAAVAIRIRNFDLRIPLPQAEAVCTGASPRRQLEALMNNLQQLLFVGGSEKERSVPSLRGTVRSQHWPLRLRRLQWGGRPGPLLEVGELTGGIRLLVELALPGGTCWPMPPYGDPSQRDSGDAHEMRHYWSTSTWSSLQLGLRSSLSARTCFGDEHQKLELPVPSHNKMMLRVLSSMSPRDSWILIKSDTTVSGLCAAILNTFRRANGILTESKELVQFLFVETQGPRIVEAGKPDSTPLRELFWAQSETVRVELKVGNSAVNLRSLLLTQAQQRAYAEQGGGYPSNGPTLVIWREQAFQNAMSFTSWSNRDACFAQRLLPSSGEGRGNLAYEPAYASDLQAGLLRQLSEPATLSNLTKACPSFRANFGRQLSEPSQPASEPCHSPPLEVYLLPSSTEAPTVGESSLDCIDVSSPVPRPHHESAPSRQSHISEELEEDDFLSEAIEEEAPSPSLATPVSSWERIVPHLTPRLLPKSFRTRQFEFHPSLQNIMLIGDKKGGVNILNTETDAVHPPLLAASCPLLGLVWMRHHPQIAVCGASQSGKIMLLKYDPDARPTEPALQRLQTAEEFPKLSSLSANCTDDFLLASGISPDLAVYDIQTAKVLTRANAVHEHFINISRFCHTSPHIFATASFDHTCKIWDIRQPLAQDRPVKSLHTGGHNVMCVFSPDDRHVLCSGVDTRLLQFEVPSWRQSPSFPFRPPVHRERYRRAMYLANGQHFVTAATEESHMHIMSLTGKKLGVIDFRGVVQGWAATHRPAQLQAAEHGCLPQDQRVAAVSPLESRLRIAHPPWRVPFVSLRSHEEITQTFPGQACQTDGTRRPQLLQGMVRLDDADPNGGSSRNNHEFIQSVRAHPVIINRVAVLLSLSQGEQSYIALVDMDKRWVA